MEPPSLLVEAATLYEAGEYFTCHEVLEALWRGTEGPLRELYRGLIQIVVGLYHVQRGNLVGGRHVLARGLARVERYPSPCVGIDLVQLCQGARSYLHWIEAGATGPRPEPPRWCWVRSVQECE
ncbi:DUF309 domain-containing protein [Thermomicrobium sp. 4228-Ro]|uniref:DUF309 domain-containing protein n=1 Tax=Thermomicrobium sp. 4228-Ro TaxID=2993937 RepID=UPI0022495AC2|nr:DUF309 domain-containing protein [Thermomicrobium sp. 4228-Ro]MCX2726381.1 DUF309 domain-containing protein [Thermomicrobium sp. 4228-Ro]